MPDPSTNVSPPDTDEHHNASKAMEPALPATRVIRSTRTMHPVASRIVQRPVSKLQLEDPRKFQLSQITRRFSPKEVTGNDGRTILTFGLKPSDPDFPFELDVLECVLEVPIAYPESKPTLRIRNEAMGRGYQINVERGFDSIVQNLPNGTLLQYFNTLDRKLEEFLSTPPADTIKLVANLGPKGQRSEPSSGKPQTDSPLVSSQPVRDPSSSHALQSPTPTSIFSAEELKRALMKRNADVRQLEARLGRIPLFAKLIDGNSYTIPVEPRKRNELPPGLQAIKVVNLVIPPNYNLEPCRIELPDSSGDEANALADEFERRVLPNLQLSLIAHVNFLSQNMHSMVAEGLARRGATIPSSAEQLGSESHHRTQIDANLKKEGISASFPSEERQKDHIFTIPRPPEWSTPANIGEGDQGESSSEASNDSSEESRIEESIEESTGEEAIASTAEDFGPERGILLSFPHLELHGIELLELISASFTLKCDRCKEAMDVNKIRNSIGDPSAVRRGYCRKCSTPWTCGKSPAVEASDVAGNPLHAPKEAALFFFLTY